MRNDPNWKRSGIPVNINLGKISHRDKLKANRNFARYIADTRTIPSRIRKEAQKFAPRRTTPRHSPHGGGPGTGVSASSQRGSNAPGFTDPGKGSYGPWKSQGGIIAAF